VHGRREVLVAGEARRGWSRPRAIGDWRCHLAASSACQRPGGRNCLCEQQSWQLAGRLSNTRVISFRVVFHSRCFSSEQRVASARGCVVAVVDRVASQKIKQRCFADRAEMRTCRSQRTSPATVARCLTRPSGGWQLRRSVKSRRVASRNSQPAAVAWKYVDACCSLDKRNSTLGPCIGGLAGCMVPTSLDVR
jgi:hypothetical protein